MITLRLVESEAEISKNINLAIATELNSKINRRLSELENNIKAFVSRHISSQPELISLSAGILRGAFGLYSGTAASISSSITKTIENSVNIKFQPFDKNLKGTLEINIQPSDLSNLLTLPEGHVKYKDGDLHWLNWLLTKGDEIIIIGYEYNPQTGIGRSGLGNMVAGSAFRVPPQFSGTIDNNFITRALLGKQQEKEISNIIQKILR